MENKKLFCGYCLKSTEHRQIVPTITETGKKLIAYNKSTCDGYPLMVVTYWKCKECGCIREALEKYASN